MTFIDCQNAAFAYEGNTVAKNLNFQVSSGDYLAIVGENGSGKSTLMKGLLGLKKPESGAIVISKFLDQKEIGYLPQQTAAQKDFPASVYEVVLSGRLSSRGLKPFYSRADKETALSFLELLGIIELKNSCYRELSGGQQQRVLLCRALCAAKKILLLDEPAAGLDPIVTQEMYQAVEDINKKRNMTIIMITHDIRSVIGQATHVLHLQNDQAFYGTVAEYKESPIGGIFLGGSASA